MLDAEGIEASRKQADNASISLLIGRGHSCRRSLGTPSFIKRSSQPSERVGGEDPFACFRMKSPKERSTPSSVVHVRDPVDNSNNWPPNQA